VTLHPDFSTHIWEGMGCAKLAITGPEIELARRRLEERAPLVRRGTRRRAALST
jgi:hypothetical protein